MPVSATAILTGTTAARTSGAQKIVCSSKDLCGSWAKADTPFPPEFVSHLAVRTVGNHHLVLTPIVGVAAETFPGDVGNFRV